MENNTDTEQLSTEMDPSMSIKSRLRSARTQKAQSEGQQTPVPQMMAAADEIPAELPALSTPVPWSRESETTPETITSSNNKRQQEKTYESTEAENMRGSQKGKTGWIEGFGHESEVTQGFRLGTPVPGV